MGDKQTFLSLPILRNNKESLKMGKRENLKLCIILMVMLLVLCACGKKENDASGGKTEETSAVFDKEANQISMEITENVRIDAELPVAIPDEAKSYKVKGKQFDIHNAADLLELDIESAEYFKNPTHGGESYSVDGEWNISESKGTLSYIRSDAVWEIINMYQEKLNTAYIDETDSLQSEEDVLFAKEILGKIYQLEENEQLVVTKAIEIVPDVVKKVQQKLYDSGEKFGTGKLDRMFVSDDLLENSKYYLSFSVMTDGIKESEADGYGYRVADSEKMFTPLSITMIVGNHKVNYINIYGARDKEELTEQELISLEEAVDVLKKKYELEIVSSEKVFSEICMEYVFVKAENAGEEDYDIGSLIPYWRFNNLGNGYAERINAMTGDDYEYE